MAVSDPANRPPLARGPARGHAPGPIRPLRRADYDLLVARGHLADERVELHRDPDVRAGRYRTRTDRSGDDRIALVGLPQVTLTVAEFLA